MAAPTRSRSWRIPGRLVKDPTDLTAAFPYGGTELGFVHKEVLRFNAEHHGMTAEEWGPQVYEVIDAGSSLVLGVEVRGFDIDMISAIFPDTAAGSKIHSDTAERSIQGRPTSVRAGMKLGDRSFALLFVPDDVKSKPGVLIYDAIPVIAEDATMAFDAETEATFNAVFYSRPDASDRTWDIAYLKDMTL